MNTQSQSSVLILQDQTFRQGDQRRHVAALDGLRAVAILLVLASHTSDDFPRFVRGWAENGWCGVDLFFVLSGYLITKGLLASKGSTNFFRSFYGKRFLRIFPVFYAALIVTFLVLPQVFSGLPIAPSRDQWFYWLYVNNWAFFMIQPQIHLIGHFWSLAVEEQFYLIWPAVVLFSSRKQLFWICVACICLAPMLRTSLFLMHLDREAIYRNTFCRMDGLMAGGLCALLIDDSRWRHRIHAARNYLPFVGAFLIVVASLTFGHSYFKGGMLTAGLSVYVAGYAVLVLSGAQPAATHKVLDWLPFRYIAMWSYGIYVYHLAFVYFAHRYQWGSGLGRVLIEVTVSIAVAAASYRFFEYPILNLKHHFAPRWDKEAMTREISQAVTQET